MSRAPPLRPLTTSIPRSDMTEYDFTPASAWDDSAGLARHATSEGGVVAFRDDAGGAGSSWPLLPWPRGPLSETVIAALRCSPGTLSSTPPVENIDVLDDDDFALALYLCYELHYRGVTDEGWEWDLDLLHFRADMEPGLTEFVGIFGHTAAHRPSSGVCGVPKYLKSVGTRILD